MGTDAEDVAAICDIIEEGNYRTAICRDLDELKSLLADPVMAAILDLDSVPLDNRTIRSLTYSHPATCFLCTSRERYSSGFKRCYPPYICCLPAQTGRPGRIALFLEMHS